ncbi:zinc finger protein 665-like [Lineus longissimus]|uniref:zinc finger protein 665-like n=1 Tax=Lineus longissimus TaxID=88925 RepID=UPI00315D3C7D
MEKELQANDRVLSLSLDTRVLSNDGKGLTLGLVVKKKPLESTVESGKDLLEIAVTGWQQDGNSIASDVHDTPGSTSCSVLIPSVGATMKLKIQIQQNEESSVPGAAARSYSIIEKETTGGEETFGSAAGSKEDDQNESEDGSCICELCGMVFAQRKCLADHLLVHSDHISHVGDDIAVAGDRLSDGLATNVVHVVLDADAVNDGIARDVVTTAEISEIVYTSPIKKRVVVTDAVKIVPTKAVNYFVVNCVNNATGGGRDDAIDTDAFQDYVVATNAVKADVVVPYAVKADVVVPYAVKDDVFADVVTDDVVPDAVKDDVAWCFSCRDGLCVAHADLDNVVATDTVNNLTPEKGALSGEDSKPDDAAESVKDILTKKSEKCFVCDECGKEFDKKYLLTAHLRVHSNVRPFACGECDKSFKTKGDLVRHALSHEGKKPFKCPEPNCGKDFFRECQLKSHVCSNASKKIKSDSSDSKHQCHECGLLFNNKNNLNSHMAIHTGEKPYVCEKCGKAFYRGTHLKSHSLCHEKEKGFQCHLCDKGFYTKSGLKKHALLHEGMKFECEVCNKSYGCVGDLKRHSLSHTGLRPFRCRECGHGFSRNYLLRNHCEQHHPDLIGFSTRPFKCEHCMKRFKDENERDKHAIVHAKKELFKCHDCEKAFGRRYDLIKHRRKHLGKHTGIFQCGECDYVFSKKSALFEHARTHPNFVPTKCQVCEKEFLSDGDVRTHMRVHTPNVKKREKRFMCEHCGKAFEFRSILTAHERLHTGEKPFSCDMCTKAYTAKAHLDTHRRLHTGERPFTCELCTKAFISRSALKDHISVHHTGQRPYECLHCGQAFARNYHLTRHCLRIHHIVN